MDSKVLMINTGVFSLPPLRGGGTEYHIYYLSNALAEMGVPLYLASDITDRGKFSKNINIVRARSVIPNTTVTNSFMEWAMRHLVGSTATTLATLKNAPLGNIDLIHLHGRLSASLIMRINKLLNLRVPMVYTLHDRSPWWIGTSYTPHEELMRKFEYMVNEVGLLRNADQVITVSQGLKEEAVNFWNIDETKLNLIQNGVSTESFRSLEKKPIILFVGRLTKRKNVPLLLEAFKKIQPTRYKLVLVGSGEEKTTIRRCIKDYDLKEDVKIFEGLSDEEMRRLYGQASIFTLPSESEGLPLSILEAMSSECVPISTAFSGVAGIVKDDINGFLVKRSDVNALAQHLEFLIDNPVQRQKMGANARKTIMKKYDWKIIAQRTLDVYRKALRSSNNS